MIDGRIAGSQLRTAAQARTKPGPFSFRRAIVKAAVGFFGRFHRTNWTAINTGRSYAHEKDAVKTWVASKERSVTAARVFCQHTSHISRERGSASRFRTSQ